MRWLVLAGVLVAGCAAIPESECRTSNWYEVGRNDARLGNRPKAELYAAQCARYQVQPAERDYLAGWAIGYSETSFRQPN